MIYSNERDPNAEQWDNEQAAAADDLQKLADLQNETPKPGTILKGYSSIDRPFKVNDYPYGFRLRTSIHYWIESKAGQGDRVCTYTIDPRNGRRNAPKCGTYSPFKYMFINDAGHVETAGIDSYDRDEFEGRFLFILNKIGVEYINDVQKANLRKDHFNHVRGNYPYETVKYSDEMKPVFKKWAQETLAHIAKCDFEKMLDYPAPPEQDNPEGEVKMIVTERKDPEPLQHSITAEKVKAILEKTLPGFYTVANEGKNTFGGGTYLKIGMAASNHAINNVAGQLVQLCSLSLDLQTLELQPQHFGGSGGQSIYREPDPANPKERFLAMARIKIPFRRPPANEKDVLAAIERFAVNYKKALIENRATLKYQDLVNYDELLK